jgi:hypothetical protein
MYMFEAWSVKRINEALQAKEQENKLKSKNRR